MMLFLKFHENSWIYFRAKAYKGLWLLVRPYCPGKKGGIWEVASWDSHEKTLLKHQTPVTFFLVPPKMVATWHPKTGMFFFNSERAVTLCKTKSSIFALWKLCGPFFSASPPNFLSPKFRGNFVHLTPTIEADFSRQWKTRRHSGACWNVTWKPKKKPYARWIPLEVSFWGKFRCFVDGIVWLVVGFMRFFFQPKKDL